MQCLNTEMFITFHDKFSCLQLAFTFTLQFTRVTFTEQFVNIAKITLWTIFSPLYLRLAGKAPTVFQVFALGEGNL